MDRTKASQQEKYVAFKTAFQTVSAHRDQKNFLAAYVVAFSVIEDRIRAAYVVWYRARSGAVPNDRQLTAGFAWLVTSLRSAQLIDADLARDLRDEAANRNTLLHAAMWNLNAFTDDAVCRAVALARRTDRECRRAAKAQVKIEKNNTKERR